MNGPNGPLVVAGTSLAVSLGSLLYLTTQISTVATDLTDSNGKLRAVIKRMSTSQNDVVMLAEQMKKLNDMGEKQGKLIVQNRQFLTNVELNLQKSTMALDSLIQQVHVIADEHERERNLMMKMIEELATTAKKKGWDIDVDLSAIEQLRMSRQAATMSIQSDVPHQGDGVSMGYNFGPPDQSSGGFSNEMSRRRGYVHPHVTQHPSGWNHQGPAMQAEIGPRPIPWGSEQGLYWDVASGYSPKVNTPVRKSTPSGPRTNPQESHVEIATGMGRGDKPRIDPQGPYSPYENRSDKSVHWNDSTAGRGKFTSNIGGRGAIGVNSVDRSHPTNMNGYGIGATSGEHSINSVTPHYIPDISNDMRFNVNHPGYQSGARYDNPTTIRTEHDNYARSVNSYPPSGTISHLNSRPQLNSAPGTSYLHQSPESNFTYSSGSGPVDSLGEFRGSVESTSYRRDPGSMVGTQMRGDYKSGWNGGNNSSPNSSELDTDHGLSFDTLDISLDSGGYSSTRDESESSGNSSQPPSADHNDVDLSINTDSTYSRRRPRRQYS
jgi:hypothetical protein